MINKILGWFSQRVGMVAFILVFSIVGTSILAFSDLSFLNVSVVNAPHAAPFDGTVSPVKKVPNWVQNDSSKWDASYSSFKSSELIDLPKYKPSDLIKTSENLSWTDADDVLIRNEKITYPVPYMGNYRLDGRENAGSHLAVDIKIPKGTPIYAIANGVVEKVSNSDTGFGHHIVIRHDNVPSYNDKSVKTTLYSSYCHLSNILVSKGDVVTKGQKIALSGETGTATTPHIHFQIDNKNAPWHPYWPFTWSEAQTAGLDFFSAVNAGLGKEKALKTTVNPMKYVQKYSSGVSSVVLNGSSDDSGSDVNVDVDSDDSGSDVNVDVDSDDSGSDVNVDVDSGDSGSDVNVDVDPVVIEPSVLQFDFVVSGAYTEGLKGGYSVLLRDQYGKVFKNGFLGNVIVKSDKGLFTPKPAILSVVNFDSGMRLDGFVTNSRPGKDRFKIEFGGKTYYSDWFRINENLADKEVKHNVAEYVEVSVDSTPSDSVVASSLDSSSSDLIFVDVPANHEFFNAIEYLAERGVVSGYEDGTFKPEQTVNRIEALKFIFLGAKLKLNSGNLPFSDTDKDEWYGRYLYTAYKNGIVNGYKDGTYRPTKVVTRAEFYKMLFEAMGEKIVKPKKLTYKDVSGADWFAKYAEHAKEIGVIPATVKNFNPNLGMTRGDVAYAIWRLMK